MKISRIFTAKDNVIDLINEDYNILPVLSRFSIPLGFGNKTIEDVCNNAGININVFLLVINYILSGNLDKSDLRHISATDLVDFLHNSHDYFLLYKFPHIRQNLLNALDDSYSDVNPMITRFFDEYVSQAHEHFEYEERVVFPYIRNLSTGEKSNYSIEEFKKHHDELREKLSDLKNVILRYYTTSMPNKMYDVLVDLFNCELDIKSHTIIEDELLTPMVADMECKKGTTK